MPRSLVLVGLSGAGKSAAGRRAAALLDARFTDVDQSLELRQGRSVAQLFAELGEDGFRRLERDLVREALRAPAHVIAPGAGWLVQPGSLEDAGGAFLIHLEVSPEVAASRLGAAADRPLLAGDPAVRLEALRQARAPWYRRAHAAIATDGLTLEQVAEGVAGLARREAGW